MAVQKLVLTDPMPGDYYYKEAIKTLRANIQFSGRNKKIIMFTSCFPGEGKSDITFHAAEEMAKMGRHVLLIDADIRKSMFVSRYQIRGKTLGLSEFLSGQAKINDVIYSTNYPRLHLILAGAYAPNPVELLADDLFQKMLDAACKVYDYIFIDTPPLGQIIDGAMIGQHCDGAILVVESGATSYRIAQKVKRQLEMTNTKILGVVLNKIDRQQGGKYGKYGRYAKYGQYGEYGAQNADGGPDLNSTSDFGI